MSITPASTGRRPPPWPATAPPTGLRWASVRKAASDDVPSTNSPCTPPATRWSTSLSSEGTSTSRSGVRGVQTGGTTPVSGAGRGIGAPRDRPSADPPAQGEGAPTPVRRPLSRAASLLHLLVRLVLVGVVDQLAALVVALDVRVPGDLLGQGAGGDEPAVVEDGLAADAPVGDGHLGHRPMFSPMSAPLVWSR